MISYLILLDILKIIVLTYLISYALLISISWYDKIRDVFTKDIKK
jgi:hypothetical protein